MINKKAIEHAKDVEKTRQLLKQFLYALHKSEGYGQERLLRVLLTWSETHKIVNDPKNNKTDEMLMIDRILDEVCPSRLLTLAIGKEKIK